LKAFLCQNLFKRSMIVALDELGDDGDGEDRED
jgi:hypothetical protein